MKNGMINVSRELLEQALSGAKVRPTLNGRNYIGSANYVQGQNKWK